MLTNESGAFVQTEFVYYQLKSWCLLGSFTFTDWSLLLLFTYGRGCTTRWWDLKIEYKPQNLTNVFIVLLFIASTPDSFSLNGLCHRVKKISLLCGSVPFIRPNHSGLLALFPLTFLPKKNVMSKDYSICNVCFCNTGIVKIVFIAEIQ